MVAAGTCGGSGGSAVSAGGAVGAVGAMAASECAAGGVCLTFRESIAVIRLVFRR
jgi:hypothetical protein